MIETDIRELNERIKNESHFIDLINLEMSKVIVGQRHMTERLLIGLLSNGHILLEGVFVFKIGLFFCCCECKNNIEFFFVNSFHGYNTV